MNKGNKVMLSEPLAASLAIAHIIEIDQKSSQVVPLSSVIYPIPNLALNSELINEFNEHPYRYYGFGFNINNEYLKIIYISSTGEIMFTHDLPLNYINFPHPKLDSYSHT